VNKQKLPYLDWGPILSYQRYITMLIGGRGIGKSYGCKKVIIKDFLKNGNQFIWLRRYKEEKKIAKDGFFTDVKEAFPGHVFTTKGNDAYIDGKLAGVFFALSQVGSSKGSVKLQKPRTLVFDEYIVEVETCGANGYFYKEGNMLLNFTETFSRTRNDFRLFILANNTSITNPLYDMFNISFKVGEIGKRVLPEIYVEQLETPEELKKMKDQTNLGKVMKKYAKDLYDYNVNNKALYGSDSKIAKVPIGAHQYMNIIDKNMVIYIYMKRDEMSRNKVFYAGLKGQKDFRLRYTFDLEQASDDVIFVDKTNLSLPIRDLANVYKRGRLFFENQQVKSLLDERLKKYL